eukprot:CAMPEP_0119329446 /NCGR_PEP_ID=MMETSP1333-20130426/75886_1 /TAXON_ID=418940 /ORGANISM="Scyphosphaera apsteinii, Strain RCC1455" /LENGTH=331 /DNA_ID=CAMNT_0007338567 /DNA_START=46 /DNA_END=1041 /DNA_ORIENTATION=-
MELDTSGRLMHSRSTSVLISFAYSRRTNDDHVYSVEKNLLFFLRHGIMARKPTFDRVVAVVTLNGPELCPEATRIRVVDGYELSAMGKQGASELCVALQRATECCDLRVLRRANTGFDFGAHGAMLRSGMVDAHAFDAFIFLNGGVRGPFIPPILRASYKRGTWHWTHAFTERLGGDNGSHLVGTSIVCISPHESCYAKYNRSCIGPTVEGFAFALAPSAMAALLDNSSVFRNHKTKTDAVLDGEYRMSMFAREHGWRMDTLLAAYQDVDWTKRKFWDCNRGKHPSRQGAYFGISMHPWETVFHKSRWQGQSNVLGKIEHLLSKWQDKHPI